MATQRLKAWFFQITSSIRLDGTVGGTRFRNTDKPPQPTFEDLLESTTFKTESGDRAKVYTGATLGSEQGLSVLANDTQAKANAVQLADRSLVTQPHQLPTIEPIANSAIEDMPTTGLFIDTAATTTRNQYQIRFLGTWLTWLFTRIFKQGGIEGDVPIKNSGTNYDHDWGNVGDNTTTVNKIATNTTFINTLTNDTNFTTALETTINNIIISNPSFISEGLEVGFMRIHPTTAMPSSKWLRADGTALDRTTYSQLFALIGTTYGTTAGTNFLLPDFRDKQITGYSAGKALGSVGGAEGVVIQTGNLPPHTHGAGTLNGLTGAPNDVSHIHTTSLTINSGVDVNSTIATNLTNGTSVPFISSAPLGGSPLETHTHVVNLNSGQSGNGGFANLPLPTLDPYLATNIIIKVLP